MTGKKTEKDTTPEDAESVAPEVTTVTVPTWGPPAPDDPIVLSDLLACQYSVTPATDGQTTALARFQAWCVANLDVDHEVQPVFNRQVRALVQQAGQQLCGTLLAPTVPTVTLFAEMQRRGAVVQYY